MSPNAVASDIGTDVSVEPVHLSWANRLISIDTVSRHSNLGLIELIRDDLKRSGIDATLTFGKDRKWANLFATIPAHDGEINGGIVLSGHTDVVPVDGQAWDSDPFKPAVREGRLYGRGACDMKGFIGTALSLIPEMQSARLSKPIHFALSFDEEVGCVGAPIMIADLMKRGISPDGCIVGEPTSMRPIVAHKGINAYKCCVRGRAVHSSLTPNGVNAIEYAARLICFISDIAREHRKNGPFDNLFDVPFTTAQASLIQGGNAINTVPAECQFQFEFRNLPTVNPEDIFARISSYARDVLLPEMHLENPDTAIEIRPLAVAPGLEATEQAAITQLVRALTSNREKRKVAYGTEAGLFQKAGIPSIVCGPGDIEQAHKANEYVEVRQLDECHNFLSKMVLSLTAPAI